MGDAGVVVRGCSFRMARQSLHEKMHLMSQELKEVRGKPVDTWGRCSGQREQRCICPEAGSCQECLGNMEEAHVAGAVSRGVMAGASRREMRAGKGPCRVSRTCKWWGGFGIGSEQGANHGGSDGG